MLLSIDGVSRLYNGGSLILSIGSGGGRHELNEYCFAAGTRLAGVLLLLLSLVLSTVRIVLILLLL